jgi:hypothetical protein
MQAADVLDQDWRDGGLSRPFHRAMTFTQGGLVLGRGTLLAAFAKEGGGKGWRGTSHLTLDGHETRVLSLLTVAYGEPVAENVIEKIRRAGELWCADEKMLAQLHLIFIGLPKIDETDAYRLFLAGKALEKGFNPSDLMKALGFPHTARNFKKYNPDQPRVSAGSGRESGRWTSGGASGAGSVSDDSELGSVADIILASQDKKDGKDKADDILNRERELLGEEPPKQELEHGRPIEPGPTMIPAFSPPRSVLRGDNAAPAADRMNSDLPGGLDEATVLFGQMTRGQPLTKKITDRGVSMTTASDGTMLRINPDGSVRIERPIEIDDKTREIIHFKNR